MSNLTDKDVMKGYITIIVFPQRSYELIDRSPSNPEVPEEELIPILVGWAQGHAVIIDKPTGYRLEYWMEDTLHYQWYEGDDLLEGEGTEPVLEPVDETDEAKLARLKAERAEAVKNIVVEVDGMLFNGDEESQNRIDRTITAATAAGFGPDDTTTWVLYDNTVATVTVKQLAQVLLLSGQKQTELWTIPYEQSSTEEGADSDI